MRSCPAGRLSASFGSTHTFLSVVLGPPEEWRGALSDSTAKPGALQAPAGSRPAPAAQQLESLRGKFGCLSTVAHITLFLSLPRLRRFIAGLGIFMPPTHTKSCRACLQHCVLYHCTYLLRMLTKLYTGPGRTVALEAHGIWARWAATALGRQLAASMEQDPALTSHVPLRNWIDTVVKHVGPLIFRFPLSVGGCSCVPLICCLLSTLERPPTAIDRPFTARGEGDSHALSWMRTLIE